MTCGPVDLKFLKLGSNFSHLITFNQSFQRVHLEVNFYLQFASVLRPIIEDPF